MLKFPYYYSLGGVRPHSKLLLFCLPKVACTKCENMVFLKKIIVCVKCLVVGGREGNANATQKQPFCTQFIFKKFRICNLFSEWSSIFQRNSMGWSSLTEYDAARKFLKVVTAKAVFVRHQNLLLRQLRRLDDAIKNGKCVHKATR